MANQEVGMQLSEANHQKLERLAAQRGISASELAAELLTQELAQRTRPRLGKGTVQPFRRRTE